MPYMPSLLKKQQQQELLQLLLLHCTTNKNNNILHGVFNFIVEEAWYCSKNM